MHAGSPGPIVALLSCVPWATSFSQRMLGQISECFQQWCLRTWGSRISRVWFCNTTDKKRTQEHNSSSQLNCDLFCTSPVQSHAIRGIQKVLGHVAACDVHQNIPRDHFSEGRSSTDTAGAGEACSLHGANAAHRFSNRQRQWRRRRHLLCRVNTQSSHIISTGNWDFNGDCADPKKLPHMHKDKFAWLVKQG